MDILTNEDILTIIKQLGYTKALNCSVKNYSDEILGYLGEHLTLTIQVDSGSVLQFFMKCLPRFDKWKAKYITEHTFFDKEYAMLDSLFEKFECKTKWRPTVYLAKKDLFVFEDVVQQGYTMVRNRDTLNLEEITSSIVTMARFHAQSLIYEEKKSLELKTSYRIWEDYSRYLQEPDKNQNWRNTGMRAIVDVLRVYSKFKDYPNFYQNIETVIPKLFQELASVTKPHPIYRNVVVHRDLWMNNLFFKAGTDGTMEVLFVDFQTVLYCPPMHDLASLLYFNTRRDFRERYLDKLMDTYYSVLREELDASNINIETVLDRETIKQSYISSTKFGILQAALLVPIVLIDDEIKKVIFSHPDREKIFYEVSRSHEMLEIAKTDERFRCHVIELFDEIVEKYIY